MGNTFAVSEFALLREPGESKTFAREVEACDVIKYFQPQRPEKVSTRSCKSFRALMTFDSEQPVKVMISITGLYVIGLAGAHG